MNNTQELITVKYKNNYNKSLMIDIELSIL